MMVLEPLECVYETQREREREGPKNEGQGG